MEKMSVIAIALVTFLVINFLYSKVLRVYVKKEFGKKWLTIWGNKVYFWQSSIFVSSAGTFLVMYLFRMF
ncbi:hypothetical protein CLV91_2582 [Maribacter vaceletii]|uniref:Uncharacterized protein n=1 Tax=Maribacter vaceletii TaxID=1206816 RepID=A0A495E702_9FLAO|nr:hypothetical protein [Maribacter vaceletii]RKR12451.1 hypothetical protein CLV91_2582 [Maribacter vaceletii]